MQTIDLECPSCSELLELDAGFAGGVCRCSNCGTLMTVPSDAGKAEQLTAPSAPGGGRESAPPRRSTGKRGKGKKKTPTSSTVEAGEYVTQTGKVIRIDKPTRVPMAASKKKQIRIVTGVVFFAVVAVVVGIAVFAIVSIMGDDAEKEKERAEQKAAEQAELPPPEYVEGANPYTLSFPNVAGVPMTGHVAVIVEASSSSARWMPAVIDMVLKGIKTGDGEGVEVGFFGAIKGDPVQQSKDGEAVGGIDVGEVKTWFEELPNKDFAGAIDYDEAVIAAKQTSPDTIIIFSGGFDEDDAARVKSALGDDESIKVYVILIDSFPTDLSKLIKDHGGEKILLRSQQIDEWKSDASGD